MSIVEFIITVFVWVDDSLKALFGAAPPGGAVGLGLHSARARSSPWRSSASFWVTTPTRGSTPISGGIGWISSQLWLGSTGASSSGRRPACCGSRKGALVAVSAPTDPL